MPQRWKVNPGKEKRPKYPSKLLYIRFVGVNGVTGKHHETDGKVKAGDYDWSHRGLAFDILEATADEPD